MYLYKKFRILIQWNERRSTNFKHPRRSIWKNRKNDRIQPRNQINQKRRIISKICISTRRSRHRKTNLLSLLIRQSFPKTLFGSIQRRRSWNRSRCRNQPWSHPLLPLQPRYRINWRIIKWRSNQIELNPRCRRR